MSDRQANQTEPVDVRALTKTLTEPFDPALIKFKPQVVSGNRAMALAYIDARVIQDRLDEVLGVEGWQDDYEALSDGSVICRLKLKLGDKWITKVDVGGQSEQTDGGDRMKAAFSDALSAAVKFGIGRYLYRLPSQWVDWDAQKRQFMQTPKLPAFALPTKPLAALRKPASRTNGLHTLPATGAELQKRLQDYDAKLAAQGICEAGALLKHILEAGAKAGYGTEMVSWPIPAITLAVDQTKTFENEAKQRRSNQKEVA